MNIKADVARLPLKIKVKLCSGQSFWRTKTFAKYGITSAVMCDGPHGLRIQERGGGFSMLGVSPSRPATCFPAEVTVASSWDTAIAGEIGRAIAEEALSQGIGCVLGPGVNIKRSPLCGRNFEYFSEDPLLAGELAAAFIRAVEELGVSACAKHFAVNSQERERFTSDSVIDERTLREIYLPAFEMAVKKGRPGAVMCAYNRLNGVYCSDNRRLLTDILRKEWGFDGLVMTDWGAMSDRVEAFKAGCDLNMPGGSAYMEREAVSAVRNGELDESSVDESARRIIRFAGKARGALSGTHVFDAAAHHALARRAACEGAVLLKNDRDTLPLRAGTRLAVIGGMAGEMRYQGSGSSHINPIKLSQPLDSLPLAVYAEGVTAAGETTPELIRRAVSAARDCEAAVIFAGLPSQKESEGFDRADMRLPDGVNRLIEAIACVNARTVVVLMCGSPVECPWENRVQAILYMGLPGEAGGEAAADLLYGRACPGGRLAESWPLRYEDTPAHETYAKQRDALYTEGIYVGYRYYATAKKRVRWPFGFGLSYSSFGYSDLRVEGDTVRARVTNTGKIEASEVAQLYISPPEGGIHRPALELRGFCKLRLAPGESADAVFNLDKRSFALWQDGWRVQRGEYTVRVGSSSESLPLSAAVFVDGEDIPAPSWQHGSWYEDVSRGAPDMKSWEALLGCQYVPQKVKRGEFTMQNTPDEMAVHSRLMRLVSAGIRAFTSLGYGSDYKNNPDYRMIVSSSAGAPLRTIQINGGVPGAALGALLKVANGFKPAKSAKGKTRC